MISKCAKIEGIAKLSHLKYLYQGALAMTPDQLRGLLPTVEVLATWGVVEDARAWVGLEQDLLNSFLDLLGSSTLTNLPLLAAVDPVVVRRAINDPPRVCGSGRRCDPTPAAFFGL